LLLMKDDIRFPFKLDDREQAGHGWEEEELEINVIFTTIPGTLAALRLAGQYARDLYARISILATQVVPYPLPLEHPPVAPEFTTRCFRTLVADQRIETRIQLYLCRESRQALLEALRPNSLVVLGGKKRWWPTREQALAKAFCSHGHRVIFVEHD